MKTHDLGWNSEQLLMREIYCTLRDIYLWQTLLVQLHKALFSAFTKLTWVSNQFPRTGQTQVGYFTRSSISIYTIHYYKSTWLFCFSA